MRRCGLLADGVNRCRVRSDERNRRSGQLSRAYWRCSIQGACTRDLGQDERYPIAERLSNDLQMVFSALQPSAEGLPPCPEQ